MAGQRRAGLLTPAGKLRAALVDVLISTLVFFRALGPFAFDLVRTWLRAEGDRLPSRITDLLDPKVFSRLSGRAVEKVEFSERLEQHANSTDRAWFKVRFSGEKKDTDIFAKIHARNQLVRALMSMFDVYRNEIDAYANMELPVRIPKVYIAKWTRSRFCLALEDLRAEKVEFPNIWETKLTEDLAQKVLTTLATIHVKFWNNAPPGCWNDVHRPYRSKLVALLTHWNVRRTLPGLVPDDVAQVFDIAVWNWDKVQAYYGRPGLKTMVHGDSHMGNFFFQPDGTVGTFDFQVKSEEHPIRDVVYFLACSYDHEQLPAVEKKLVRFYLAELARLGAPADEIPTFDQAWLEYRLHALSVLYAFVFSGGFSNLMDAHQTDCGLRRIVSLVQRVDTAGALDDLLSGKI